MKILGLFVAVLVGSVLIIPRKLHSEILWKSRGSIEGITTAIFFGTAGIAAYIGLSPIIGAFAVGMAIASTKLIKQVGDYAEKLQYIFATFIFCNYRLSSRFEGINLDVIVLAIILISIAIFTKLIGCGISAMMILKNKSEAKIVGVGIISRGEVGLIVTGLGVTSGVLSSDIYTSIIIMVAFTTILLQSGLRNPINLIHHFPKTCRFYELDLNR